MLQPAAALSAFEGHVATNVCHRRAADQPTRRSRRGRLERRRIQRSAAVRAAVDRAPAVAPAVAAPGLVPTAAAAKGTRQSTRSNRQTTRSSTSSNRQSARSGTRDTRQNTRSSNVDSRQQGRTSRTDQRQSGRNDRVNNRSNTRRDAVNNWDRYGNGWYSGSSWSNNRPWNNGWYGGSYYNNWRWYPGQAAAWGLAGMATFGTINSLVNSAQSSQVSYIEVPNSDYSLYYPSVTATGDVVSFEADNGYDTARFNANCRNGTLNGGAPLNANEAQLLNAACQVAFGQ